MTKVLNCANTVNRQGSECDTMLSPDEEKERGRGHKERDRQGHQTHHVGISEDAAKADFGTAQGTQIKQAEAQESKEEDVTRLFYVTRKIEQSLFSRFEFR